MISQYRKKKYRRYDRVRQASLGKWLRKTSLRWWHFRQGLKKGRDLEKQHSKWRAGMCKGPETKKELDTFIAAGYKRKMVRGRQRAEDDGENSKKKKKV